MYCKHITLCDLQKAKFQKELNDLYFVIPGLPVLHSLVRHIPLRLLLVNDSELCGYGAGRLGRGLLDVVLFDLCV